MHRALGGANESIAAIAVAYLKMSRPGADAPLLVIQGEDTNRRAHAGADEVLTLGSSRSISSAILDAPPCGPARYAAQMGWMAL